MNNQLNDKIVSFVDELQLSLNEIKSVERMELDESEIDSKLLSLKQEDDEYGTHNLEIKKLEYERKIYDAGILLHPIVGFFRYKKRIDELTYRIDKLKGIDNVIREHFASSMQLKMQNNKM